MVAGAFGVGVKLHGACVMRGFDAEQPGRAHCCLHGHGEEQDPQDQAAYGTHGDILANGRGKGIRNVTAGQRNGSP